MAVSSSVLRLAVAVLGGVVLAGGSLACAAKKPPELVGGAPALPQTYARVRGTGVVVSEPRRVSGQAPVYPRVAMLNKAEGSVTIEAVIGKDGSVTDGKLLRSSPEFDQAALEAVQSWKYSPTLVNGEPVEVMMIVTVRFRLRQP